MSHKHLAADKVSQRILFIIDSFNVKLTEDGRMGQQTTDNISDTVSIKMEYNVEEFRIPVDEVQTVGVADIARLNGWIIHQPEE